ncbi:hypothetical protein FRB99_008280 [Tulasnella sp. 403]|nr:hypothetical protein FRB99_008280 [Tulasnella sp. 403]
MLTRAIRRTPIRTVAIRSYTDSRIAGATAQSREFGKKEKAHEDQYARQQEALAIEKLRKKIEQQKQALAELEKEVEQHSKNGAGKSA